MAREVVELLRAEPAAASRLLATAAAAEYLGFKTRGGIRHLIYNNELLPDGRGYRGGYVFTTETLDRWVKTREAARERHSPPSDEIPRRSDDEIARRIRYMALHGRKPPDDHSMTTQSPENEPSRTRPASRARRRRR